MNEIKKDVLIVGAGIGGLFTALNIDSKKSVIVICKKSLEENDSYLAQGGISCLLNDEDYDDYFEDTMRAGHYENDKEAVELMIKSSKSVIKELEKYDISFDKLPDGTYDYTKEGGHKRKRILHYKDATGHEITSKLLKAVSKRKNITLLPYTNMIDIIIENKMVKGVIAEEVTKKQIIIKAKSFVLATGGIGGLYKNSTNYKQLTGDAISIALVKDIKVKDLNYVQIHPTAFYDEKSERRFLISESMRGEGAILLNKKKKQFANELLPRDKLTKLILEEMKKNDDKFVYLDARPIGDKKIKEHFPNIYEHCLKKGIDITKELIRVAPAQHYFMGGIKVDKNSKTSVQNLYAVGETACTGVHGKNRLASNSLLEALVFAKQAAKSINK